MIKKKYWKRPSRSLTFLFWTRLKYIVYSIEANNVLYEPEKLTSGKIENRIAPNVSIVLRKPVTISKNYSMLPTFPYNMVSNPEVVFSAPNCTHFTKKSIQNGFEPTDMFEQIQNSTLRCTAAWFETHRILSLIARKSKTMLYKKYRSHDIFHSFRCVDLPSDDTSFWNTLYTTLFQTFPIQRTYSVC